MGVEKAVVSNAGVKLVLGVSKSVRLELDINDGWTDDDDGDVVKVLLVWTSAFVSESLVMLRKYSTGAEGEWSGRVG